jgi:microcompartment protein CcmK/EutM
MKLGQVIGTVVATHKDEKLRHARFLVLQKLDSQASALYGHDDYMVAVDPLGAGVSEIVLYVESSPARFGMATPDRPVDACIVGIVDCVEHSGEVKYQKDEGILFDEAADEAAW